MKAALVTCCLIGPSRSGGLATAVTALAQCLARDKIDVTVFHVPTQATREKSWAQHVEHYARQGIKLVPVPPPPRGMRYSFPSQLVKDAFAVYRCLQNNPCDVIYFHDWHGLGYFAVAAKRQGLAFTQTTFVTVLHCPTLHWLEGNRKLPEKTDDLLALHMERSCAAASDVVISPSQYMMEKVQAEGWQLPPSRQIIPNPLTTEVQTLATRNEPQRERQHRDIRHIVFFGRLEPLKGLDEFLYALDRLAALVNRGLLRPFRVSFLGKPNYRGTRDILLSIRERARHKQWPCPVEFLPDFHHQAALEWLLRDPSILVALPSRAENSPYAVRECIALGIPLLTTDVGGNAELIAPEDRPRALCAPNAESLTSALAEGIHDGARALVEMPHIASASAEWRTLNRTFGSASASPLRLSTRSPQGPDDDLISVCIPHHNRAGYLMAAIESVFAQDYPNIELIVVDDGSDEPESVALIANLRQRASDGTLAVDDRTLPFRLIEQSNAYVGAARNAAARTAHGDWLAFLDDDDIAQPDWLSTLRSAAAAADADVVTCMIAAFSADGGAADQGSNAYQWLALGNAPELGFFVNVFGAYCALYRAAVLQALGGFVEVRGVTFEDYALLSRASLAGFRLEYVARPLVRYREHASTHIMGSTSPYRNRLLGLQPYLDAVPEPLRPMLLFAHGHWRTSR